MTTKTIRRHSRRLAKKFASKSRYERMSSFHFAAEARREDHYTPRQAVNARRISLHRRKYKTRVFDRNMVAGLCFGKFYGRDRILYARRYGASILKPR